MMFIGDHWSMWVHHLIGIAGAGSILYVRVGAYWPALFCITEITALPNNVVWYLQTMAIINTASARDKKSKQVLTMSESTTLDSVTPPTTSLLIAHIFRWVSFAFMRIWIAPYSVYHAYQVCGGWSGVIEAFAAMPVYSMVGIPLVAGTMGLLNVVWTIAITNSLTRCWGEWASGVCKVRTKKRK